MGKKADILGRRPCKASRPHDAQWDKVNIEKGRNVEGREHGLGRARETILLPQQNTGENSGE